MNINSIGYNIANVVIDSALTPAAITLEDGDMYVTVTLVTLS